MSQLPARDLFAINAGSASELDGRTVSPALRQAFQMPGEQKEPIQLSDRVDIRVEVAGSRWLLIDRTGPVVYRIRKSVAGLAVQTGTTVIGCVIASDRDAQGNDVPLEGVTIRVDG
jgi:hypothetical protein